MFDLVQWKQTRFYQDVEREGEIKGKLKTVPLLLKLGLTTQQIALELQLDLDMVARYIAEQNQ